MTSEISTEGSVIKCKIRSFAKRSNISLAIVMSQKAIEFSIGGM